MPPAVGTRFGRYELVERLGAGGMGEVFRARDHDLGREVAVKFLPERFAADPDRLSRFFQEARAASSLNHPNIVTVHEIGQPAGLPCLVMELVEGQTLRELIDGKPLPPKRVLDIAAQLADGLAKAHAAGIVHRDLKPENVMVTRDGFVKILDFGLAKLLANDRSPESGLDERPPTDEAETRLTPATKAGAILGTAGYMSPEQARGEAADHRSDQFAVGAILYELVARRPAFRRGSFVQTLAAVIESEPEPLASLNPEFPAPARWVVERCLAKDLAHRYASTIDLAEELHDVRDHLSEVGRGDPPARRDAPGWRRARATRYFTVVALLVLAVLLAPSVARTVSRWWRDATWPKEMRVAVLPVTVDGTGAGADCCAGLLEYVAVRLTDLARFQGRVSVVPVTELLAAGVKSPSAARRAVGATLAVSVSVHRAGASLLVSVSLSDAERVRQLAGTSKSFQLSAFSPEDVVGLLVPLLDLQLRDSDRSAWNQASPGVAEAGLLYAQGLGQTPYQQARGKLERYDQARSLEQAIRLFNEAIILDPRYAAAHASLAEARLRLYRLTKRSEELTLAQQSVRQALAIDDTRPAAWMTLGMILAQQGDAGGAQRAFDAALVRDPRGADTYRELGLAYQRAGTRDKSEAAYRRAVALQPTSWANYNYLGYFLQTELRYPEAEAAFRRALDLAPDNARVWANLGALYLLQKRWRDAESTLATAIERYPSAAALSNLGYLEFTVQRRFAEAARTFEQAADAAPRDGRIWRNLAAARYWAGEHDRAAVAYQRAAALFEEELAIDPADSPTLVALADCRAMLGERRQARDLLARALKAGISPDDWTTVVGVLEESGNRPEALRQLEAALRAGTTPEDVEEDPTFDAMRKDPRYVALVKKHQGRQSGNAR
jgi:tetratricopeptide (TPR) repeat protein